jgi:hypothetical protein
MRRILSGDLIAAAAVLAAAPIASRAELARQILAQTHAAHAYFKRFGRPHALWGDGSLLTRALAFDHRTPPNLSDAAFLCVLAQMARACAAHKGRQTCSSPLRHASLG